MFFMEIERPDINFLQRLSSLYEALTLGATDPVTITSYTVGDEKSFAPQFYDTFDYLDGRDLTFAMDVMLERKAHHSRAIEDHFIHFGVFTKFFQEIEELFAEKKAGFFAEKKAGFFAEKVNRLCERVEKYSKEVVLPHQQRHPQRNAVAPFLYIPSCCSYYKFFLPECNLAGHLVFNKSWSQSGLLAELNLLSDYAKSIEAGRLLPRFNYRIATQEDSGFGFFDSSLRGRYELAKELLRRVPTEDKV